MFGALAFIAVALVIAVAVGALVQHNRQRDTRPGGRHHWDREDAVSAVMLTITLRREHDARLRTRTLNQRAALLA